MHRRAWTGGLILAVVALFAVLGIALAAGGVNISATEGAPFTGRVADIDSCVFSNATIDWGDSSSATAGQSDGGTTPGVKGTHTYAEEGTYHGTVTYSTDCTRNGVATFTASVGDSALSAAGLDVHPTAGQSFTVAVSHFNDTDPQGAVGDYRATIDWGDGSQSVGSVSASSGGGFDVSGTHTYQSAGRATVTVTSTDVGGSVAHSSSTATIAAAPPQRPVCQDLSASTGFGQAIQITFTCSGPAGYAIVVGPAHGTLSALDSAAGTVTYIPSAGYAGADSFTYKATNASGDSNIVTANITVSPSRSPSPRPPTVLIDSPATGTAFKLNAAVKTRFTCTDVQGAPGIKSCTDSNGASGSAGRLDTARTGAHRYTVTATSKDGKSSTATIGYSVRRSLVDVYPEVTVPAKLINAATQPCVYYLCPGNPAKHLAFLAGSYGLGTNNTAPYDACAADPTLPCAPMDLVPSSPTAIDDNGFLLNPNWAWYEHYNPQWSRFRPWSYGNVPRALPMCAYITGSRKSYDLGNPPCTSQHTVPDFPGWATMASFICPMGRVVVGSTYPQNPFDIKPHFSGHINYGPATFQGTVNWREKAAVGTDDDYDFDLKTATGGGATMENNAPDVIHLEFDSDQTVDRWAGTHQWWSLFKHYVHQGIGNEDKMVNGAQAVVTGNIGIDAAHSASVESHPVYAMAIHTNGAFDNVPAGAERWAIFARDWGNEGYCSMRNHPLYLPSNKLRIRIPWSTIRDRHGALPTGVKIVGENLWTSANPPSALGATVLPGEGLLLSFDMPAPAQEPAYWGSVDIKWTYGGQPLTIAPSGPAASIRRSAVTRPATRAAVAKLPPVGGEKNDVEAIAGRLIAALPRAARNRMLASLPYGRRLRPGRVKREARVMVRSPTTLRAAPQSIGAPTRDSFWNTFSHDELTLVCVAFKNRVPGFPAMCRSMARKRRR
ncbi:MAG: Ig-like domain-containing protein [Solirubrobacteraceae bacterium]